MITRTMLGSAVVAGACLAGCGGSPSRMLTSPSGESMRVLSTRTLDGGVIVDELRAGQGREVTTASTVVVHTRGWFPSDGREFYSTFGSEPLEAVLTRLIPGWQAGLLGMQPGGVRHLFVPWTMAYGEKGKFDPDNPAEGIPPRADLEFWVELLEVK